MIIAAVTATAVTVDMLLMLLFNLFAIVDDAAATAVAIVTSVAA